MLSRNGIGLAAAAILVLVAGCQKQDSGNVDNFDNSLAGTCVQCHDGITSPHDRFGLRCTDCHGGDAGVDVLGTFPDVVARMRNEDPETGIRVDATFQAILKSAHVTPATPEVARRYYANGMDDDGDGLVDETAAEDGSGIQEFAVFDNNAADGFAAADSTVGDIIDQEFSEDLNYTRFLNPGDFRVARVSCGEIGPAAEFVGQCHGSTVAALRRSIMTTIAGVAEGAYYGNKSIPGNRAGLETPLADSFPPDPRGGRFGFVLDYESADALYDKTTNQFTPNSLVLGTSATSTGAVVAKIFRPNGDPDKIIKGFEGLGPEKLNNITDAAGRPRTTIIGGFNLAGETRFKGFGGKDLQHPQRPLASLSDPPDRPIFRDATASTLIQVGQAVESEVARTAAELVGVDGPTLDALGMVDAVDNVANGFRFASNLLLPGHQRNFFLKRYEAGGGDDNKHFFQNNNPFLRFRASGCTACHMLYVDPVTLVNDGQNREPTDPTVRFNGRNPTLELPFAMEDDEKAYPSLHKLTTRIPTEQCAACHTFVTRVDLAYEARWELHGGLEADPWDNQGLDDAQQADPARRTDVHNVAFTQPAAGSDPQAPSAGDSVVVHANLPHVRSNVISATPAKSDFTIIHDGELRSEDKNNNGFLDAGEDLTATNGETTYAAGVLDLPDRIERSKAGDGRQNRMIYGGHNGAIALRDVHEEVGVTCIDCHFLQDNHGDGQIYARNWDFIEIECEDCHGTPETLGDLKTSGPTGGTDLTLAVDESGKPFFEFAANGDRIQRSRVVPGLEWRISQVKEAITPGNAHFNERALAAMGVDAQSGPFTGQNAHIAEKGDGGRLECYSCHNAYTPNCLSCHYEMDSSQKAVGIWLDGEERQGFANFQLFGFTRSPFVLGFNGLTEGKASANPLSSPRDAQLGKMSPFRSLMEVHVSVTEPAAGETVLGNLVFPSGQFGEVTSSAGYQMYMPHTVRLNETKDCDSCHTLVDSSETLVQNAHLFNSATGRGTGRYHFVGDWLITAASDGLHLIDFKQEKAGKDRNVWPGFNLSDGVLSSPVDAARLGGLDAPRFASPVGLGSDPAGAGAGAVGFDLAVGDSTDTILIRNFTPGTELVRAIDLAVVSQASGTVSVVDVSARHVLNPDGSLGLVGTLGGAVTRTPIPTVSVNVGAAANAVAHQSPDVCGESSVFVATGSDGLAILSLANYYNGFDPAAKAGNAPTITATTTWPGADARDLELRGELVFVADGTNGVTIVNVKNQASPSFVTTVPLDDAGGTTTPVALSLTVMDRFVYVAAEDGGVQVLDWANATTLALDASSLRHVETFRGAAGNLIDDANEVALHGNIAVIAGGTNGVHFLDSTTPASLSFHPSQRFNGSATGTISLVNENAGDPLVDVVAVTLGSVPLVDFAAISDAGGNRVVVVDITDPLDSRERMAPDTINVGSATYAGFADDPNHRFSLQRRDPMTPRKARRSINPTAATGMQIFPLPAGAAPARIAKGSEFDRIADESGRRLRESWQEGAGVIETSIQNRMRAVVVKEGSAAADQVDLSGNGLRNLQQVSPSTP